MSRNHSNHAGEKIDMKRMAHHHHHHHGQGGGKKEPPKESLLHLHPDGTEEEIDKEWEEFSRLMEKFKESRKNQSHRYTYGDARRCYV